MLSDRVNRSSDDEAGTQAGAVDATGARAGMVASLRATHANEPRSLGRAADSVRRWRDSFRHEAEVVRVLAVRDFALSYRRSTLGVLWSLIVPLAHLMVLVLVFQFIVPLNIDAYAAFVFSVLLPWGWLSSCLGSAGGLFLGNRDLMLRVNFAPITLPIAHTLSNLVTFLAALPVLAAVLAWYGRPFTHALIWFPVLVLIQSILLVGFALIIATLNVFYRDVQYIVSVLLTLLFYLTPVFYQVQGAIAQYRLIYTINPIAVLMRAYRGILFDGVSPSWSQLLFASGASLVMVAVGVATYRWQEHDLLDSI